jgi:Tol biopolymer transport system component
MFGGASSIISVVAVDAATGQRKDIFSSPVTIFGNDLTWLPTGSGLLGLVSEQSSNFTRSQIGFITYPQGHFSPVTRDVNSYSDLSVSGDGRVLATVQNEPRWNLMVMPAATPGAQPRIVGSTAADTNITWTKDNHLISDQANSLNTIDPLTGTKTVIPGQSGPGGAPWACRQSGYIVSVVFDIGSGAQSIWRMDSTGGNSKRLTNGKVDTYPVCSSDGKLVYFVDQINEHKLSRVSIDGGSLQTISDLPVSNILDVSPDGKWIVFPTLQHSGEHQEMLAIVEADSGKTSKLAPFERQRFGAIHFAPDGRGVVYPTRDKGVDNLWLQPLDGSKGKQITDFTAERINDFRWSFDGKQWAFVRGHTESDVVLIRDNTH